MSKIPTTLIRAISYGALAFAMGGKAVAQSVFVTNDNSTLNQTDDASNPNDSVIIVSGLNSTINLIGADITGGPFVGVDGPTDTDGLDFAAVNFLAREGTVNIDANSSITSDSFGISSLLSVLAPFGVDTTNVPIAESEFLVVNNAGSILSAREDGVRGGAGLTLFNSGRIEGGSLVDGAEYQNLFTSAGDGVSAFHSPSFAGGIPDELPLSSVTNTETGEIIGGFRGVLLSGGGEIINDGTITGEATGAGIQFQFFSLFDPSVGDTVVFAPRQRALITNNGLISSDVADGATLLSISTLDTVQSFDLSTIETPDDAMALFDLPVPTLASDAAFAEFDAVLVNTGVIETSAGLDGQTIGAVFDPATGQQLPSVNVTTFYAAPMVSAAGYIYNGDTGIIRAPNGANAMGLAGVDIVNEISGTIRLTNDGLIDGNISGSDGQEMILNNGTLDGSVGLGGGDDLIILSDGSTFTGNIILGDGDDVLIADTNASLGGFADGGDGDDFLGLILGGSLLTTDQLFGFERVQTFGTGDISGLDLSQVSEINLGGGGALDIGSTGFAGALFVGPGGTVVGTGELEFLVVNGGGTVAPGNSIGTFTVTDDVTFSAGSTYDVEVTATANDQVIASGTATIEGGQVLVSGEDGVDLAAGLSLPNYVIVSGDDGVTGQFDSVSDTLQFYHARLASTDTQSLVVLVPVGADFLSVAQTRSQVSLGGLLQGSLLGASGDFLDVMLTSFPGQSDAQVRAGLNSVGGQFHGASPIAASQLGLAVGRAVHRDEALEQGQRSFWTEGVYEAFEFDEGEEIDSTALIFGAEVGLGSGVAVGAFGGVALSTVEDVVGSETEADGYVVGASARGAVEGFELAGSIGYLDQSSDSSTRNIRIRSLNRTARSDADTDGFFASIEGSYLFPVTENLSVGPVASFSGTTMERELLSEAGAGSLNLTLQDMDFVRNVIRAGVRAEADIGSVAVSLKGGWQDDISDRSVQFEGNLEGLAGSFVGESARLSDDAAFIDAKVSANVRGQTTLSVGYQGVFGDLHDTNAGYARLTFRF